MMRTCTDPHSSLNVQPANFVGDMFAENVHKANVSSNSAKYRYMYYAVCGEGQ